MDVEKLVNAIKKAKDEAASVGLDRITAPFKETDMILELLKRQKWHFFHVRELTDEEKVEHPDWVSITECDDYEPNNGEEFLYYRKCFNSIGIDTWDDDMWADYACTGDGENIEDGDAWMELPEKPYRR